MAYPAYIQGVEEMLNGAVGIYGRVSQRAVSEFVLVVNNGLMHAYLQDGLDTYEVRYQSGGHLIVEVDSSRYPDSLPPMPAPQTHDGAVVQAEAIPQADMGDYIDVLGVYTPRAKNAVPYATIGETDVELRIEASILSANLGYANSGVTQRLRLVGMDEVNYDEIIPGQTDAAMWSYALYRLAFGYYETGGDSPSANYLLDARDFRDMYGADLVFMLTDLPYSYCGLGFIGGDPGDAAVGYSIEHWYCSGSTSYSVQHEMGHNMGACHDRANSSISIRAFHVMQIIHMVTSSLPDLFILLWRMLVQNVNE
ncbi:MAG: M12 family metallo-peptidase [Anaerolineales bacterium]